MENKTLKLDFTIYDCRQKEVMTHETEAVKKKNL